MMQVGEEIFSIPELDYFGENTLKPQMDDLLRLYDHIIDNHVFTILEFGCGYSTIVMAQALQENKRRWEALETKPPVRNSKMFQLHFVDTNSEWVSYVLGKCIGLPIVGMQSRSFAWERADQICHTYDSIPDIVPDFIYLDGPDPKEVEGDVKGMTFHNCPERTPMAADILLMESTLLPGTTIIVDGRTNNARFLANNFKRPWNCVEYAKDDFSLQTLMEPRLGKINVTGKDVWQEITTDQEDQQTKNGTIGPRTG